MTEEQENAVPEPPKDIIETKECKSSSTVKEKERSSKKSELKTGKEHKHHHHHSKRKEKDKKGKGNKIKNAEKEKVDNEKETIEIEASKPALPQEEHKQDNPPQTEAVPDVTTKTDNIIEKTEEVPKKEESDITQASASNTYSPRKARDGYILDRYGFEVEEGKKISKKERELIKEEKEKETEREAKWIYMIAHWKDFSTKKRKKLEERVRKGIPDAFRAKVWRLLIDPDSETPAAAQRPHPRTLYPHYEPGDEKAFIDHDCWKVIEVDLQRTMPTSAMFSNETVLASLRSILRAYSIYDKETEYTQGMAFTAAMLLAYLDETNAYYCYQSLMQSPRFELRYYFNDEFSRLKQLTNVWNVILRDKYKKIDNHLRSIGIDSMMYSTQWFLSSFMSHPFVSDLRMRIFDRFVTFGSRAMLSFGLVIISRIKEVLMHSELDEALPALQRPAEAPSMADWRYVMRKWDEKWLEEKETRRYFKKAGIEWFP